MRKQILAGLVCLGIFGAALFDPPVRADDLKHPTGVVQILTWAGTTDAAGAYNGAVSGVSKTAVGWITNVEFECKECTALYDVTIQNSNSLDRALGVGANLASGVSETALTRSPVNNDGGYQFVNEEALAPRVTNGGASKAFIIRMTVVY